MAYENINRLLKNINEPPEVIDRLPASIDPLEVEDAMEVVSTSNPKAPPVDVTMDLSSPYKKQLSDIYSSQVAYIRDKKDGAQKDYDSQLEKRLAIPKPQGNEFDQILGAMIPLAVAAFGGEAGALSQPGAFKSYQGYLEDDAKKKKEDYERKVKDADLKLKSAETRRNQLDNKETSLVTDAAWKAAQMDITADNQDKNRTSRVGSGSGTSKVDDYIIKRQAGDIAKQMSDVSFVKNQLVTVAQQLQNPNISFQQKLQIADRAGKVINSPLGRDALGNAEADRALALLSPFPSLKKPKPGPDIGAFAESLILQAQGIETTLGAMQGELDRIKQNKPFVPTAPKSSKPENSQAPAQAETMVIKNKDGSVRTFKLQPNGKYKEVK